MKIDMAVDMAEKVAARIEAFPPAFADEYSFLLMMSEMTGREQDGWKYRNYYDLLLDLAPTMKRARPVDLPFGIDVMEAKQCFYNAAMLSLENDDLYYTEGYASGFGLFVEHAWVQNAQGDVIDPTWAGINNADEEAVYIGIPWTREAYATHTVRKGSWPSVFHTDRMSAGFEMLRKGLTVRDGFVV